MQNRTFLLKYLRRKFSKESMPSLFDDVDEPGSKQSDSNINANVERDVPVFQRECLLRNGNPLPKNIIH